MMKTPVVLVAAALTVAILLSALFVIVTETRGDNSPWRRDQPSRACHGLTTICEK
jgi:hypothetical protein